MRIASSLRPIGGLPLVGLADTMWVLLGVTLLAGLLGAERGVLFEPGPGELGSLPPLQKAPIFVRILPDGSLEAGGRVSSPEELSARACSEAAEGREAVLVLQVADDAPYESVVSLLDELLEPSRWTHCQPPIVSLPTHQQIAEYVRAYGGDPFGGRFSPSSAP